LEYVDRLWLCGRRFFPFYPLAIITHL
jgi:hypothetical protein